jgi:hypothetical protein
MTSSHFTKLLLWHIFQIYHTIRGNDLCHARCYTCHTPYAHGLRSGPTKWIIWRITRKRKSTKLLSYITHDACLWSRYITTPVGRCDSDRMPDSGRKTRLWSYARLQLYILTPDALPDSGRRHDTGRISWLRSRIMASVDEHAAFLIISAVKDFAWPD